MANKKSALLASAVAGLLTAGMLLVPAAALAEDVECHGVNSCKGTGQCGGKGHSCAGQNTCKGQGWVKMDKDQCVKKGGTATPAEEKK